MATFVCYLWVLIKSIVAALVLAKTTGIFQELNVVIKVLVALVANNSKPLNLTSDSRAVKGKKPPRRRLNEHGLGHGRDVGSAPVAPSSPRATFEGLPP